MHNLQLLYHIRLPMPFAGESILHMAIVNEDPAMVKFILDNDEWNLHKTRCLGSFFAAKDQLDSRTDLADSEDIISKPKTNYQGNILKRL